MAGDYRGLYESYCHVSLHPPRADADIHRIISKESECSLIEINRCRTFLYSARLLLTYRRNCLGDDIIEAAECL